MNGGDGALPTRWWWVRHAPVVDAHLLRLSGQADVDADTSDDAAFRALAACLPKGAVWVLSNLRRTRQTAEALWEAGGEAGGGAGGKAGAGHPADPLVEPAFAEQAFGDWTGLTWAEVGAAEDARAFWDAPADTVPPSAETGLPAESFADQCARVRAGIETLTARHAGRDIVAVAHAGTVRAAVALALGLDPAQALALDVRNLGLTRLDHIAGGSGGGALRVRRGGHWRVVAVNQIC